ncbi:MAG: hypothetical protein M3157_00355 [Actinomycetota bacterium]|nr:hypothetical protein [Actinomycetota bacterium]
MSTEQKLPKGESNPLFWAVVFVVVVAVLAACMAGDEAPSTALYSNIVFRVEVGAVTAFVLYVAAGALWLGWHKTMFKRIGFSAANVETPEQQAEITKRDDDINKFMDKTTKAVAGLEERVTALEPDNDNPGDTDGDNGGAKPADEPGTPLA